MDALVRSRVSPKINAGGLEVTVSRYHEMLVAFPGHPGGPTAGGRGRPAGLGASCLRARKPQYP